MAYLNSLKESGQWQFLLDKFYGSPHVEVQLVALQSLQDFITSQFVFFPLLFIYYFFVRFRNLSETDKDFLRKMFWRYLVEVIPQTNQYSGWRLIDSFLKS